MSDAPFDVVDFPGPVTRFHENITVDPETGCWLWTGKRVSINGYGRWRHAGKEVAAHRFAYELHVGPIGPSRELDHTCARWSDLIRRRTVNRLCCNPNHLKPITPRENTLLSNNPCAINARKTTCKRGHPLTGRGADVRRTPQGRRECRRCKRELRAKARAKKPRVPPRT